MQLAEMFQETKSMQAAEMVKEISRIHGKMMLARQFPRDIDKAVERILRECERPEVAENAEYEYSRGGTAIVGPSIRLAEVVAQNWGNTDFGLRELSSEVGKSEMQAFCWDLETNVSKELTFTVRHGRYSRAKGFTEFGENSDPREVYETTANFGARRMRNCIQSVVPGWVFQVAQEKANDTLKKLVTDIPAAIDGIKKNFLPLGITPQHIEEKFRKNIDKLKVTEILRLRRIYKSIKDGMGSPWDFFNIAKPAGSNGKNGEAGDTKDKLNEKLKAKKNETKGKDQGENQTEEVIEVKKVDIEALVMYANKMKDDERKKFMEFWNDAEARWIDAAYWLERLKHLKHEAEKKKK